MLSRRGLLHRTFISGCAACAALAISSKYRALAIDAARPNEIEGAGYKLWVDAKPETPAGMAAHQKIQIPFEIHEQEATLVGFWSDKHHGIFTPMASDVHIHFQTSNNDNSGHVQGIDLGQGGMSLRLPEM